MESYKVRVEGIKNTQYAHLVDGTVSKGPVNDIGEKLIQFTKDANKRSDTIFDITVNFPESVLRKMKEQTPPTYRD